MSELLAGAIISNTEQSDYLDRLHTKIKTLINHLEQEIESRLRLNATFIYSHAELKVYQDILKILETW